MGRRCRRTGGMEQLRLVRLESGQALHAAGNRAESRRRRPFTDPADALEDWRAEGAGRHRAGWFHNRQGRPRPRHRPAPVLRLR
ncbi:hypothetical protein G6F63_016173 [Rhizopus arrhizus]|nr:hypothetical protein G6F63_016173 [Rhizopus arrhizus]